MNHLSAYLNDHLAGSVVALDLLRHLERVHGGTPLEKFCAELRGDIEDDRRQLLELMGRLDIGESSLRQAAGWLSEKATRIKLELEDPSRGPLYLLEALDGVGMGIHGKHSLWTALAAASEEFPALRSLDYATLIRRAEEQRGRVEAVRLEAAKSLARTDAATPTSSR